MRWVDHCFQGPCGRWVGLAHMQARHAAVEVTFPRVLGLLEIELETDFLQCVQSGERREEVEEGVMAETRRQRRANSHLDDWEIAD